MTTVISRAHMKMISPTMTRAGDHGGAGSDGGFDSEDGDGSCDDKGDDYNHA